MIMAAMNQCQFGAFMGSGSGNKASHRAARLVITDYTLKWWNSPTKVERKTQFPGEIATIEHVAFLVEVPVNLRQAFISCLSRKCFWLRQGRLLMLHFVSLKTDREPLGNENAWLFPCQWWTGSSP